MEVIMQQPPTLDIEKILKDDINMKSKFEDNNDQNNNEVGMVDQNTLGQIVKNGYIYDAQELGQKDQISSSEDEKEVDTNEVQETNIKNLEMTKKVQQEEMSSETSVDEKDETSSKRVQENLKIDKPATDLSIEDISKKECKPQECHVEVEIVSGEAELHNVLTKPRPIVINAEPVDRVVVNVDNLKSTNKLVPLLDNNIKPIITNDKSAIVEVLLTTEEEPSEPQILSKTSPGKRALVRVLLLTMLALSILVAVIGLVWLYLGPLVAALLLVVASTTYVVSSGVYRWFYVAFKTLPRDFKAGKRYLQTLWKWHGFQRKNLSIGEIFAQVVKEHPNKVCFHYEDTQWAFCQVDEYSNRVANVFKSHGYRKGDTVALFMENKPEFVCIWLGLSKLGVIVPLINTNLRASSLLHSFNVAKCQAIIFGSELHEVLGDIADKLDSKVALYELQPQKKIETNSDLKARNLNTLLVDSSTKMPQVADKVGINDVLVYIYTSGTTGLPKAAIITHSKYAFIAAGIHYVGVFRKDDVLYTPLPLYHTAGGIMSIGQSICFGMTTVIRKKFSASAYLSDCRKYDCTIAQYIGEMCRYILAVPPQENDKKHKLRVIYGNGLRPQIWQEFVDRFGVPQVTEFYGATEGNANIVNVDGKVGAIGFVSRIAPILYPISIIRVDENGEPVRDQYGLCIETKPDEPGAFIGKINPNNPSRAFLGYVDKKASEKKIIRDVFQKGDQAFISGDILVADELGYLFFKDRTGDTFRWKGENVSTSEVEGIVSNLVNYRDAIVYGVEIHGQEGRAGMAAIYDPDNTVDLVALANGLKKELPAYARPLIIRILPKLDLTGTFKLKKVDLQKEAYDPNRVDDKLYYLNSQGLYQPLTQEAFDQINSGKIRF